MGFDKVFWFWPLVFSLYLLPHGSIGCHQWVLSCGHGQCSTVCPLSPIWVLKWIGILDLTVKSEQQWNPAYFIWGNWSKPILSKDKFRTVMYAFITTELDYCNSLYLGIRESSLTWKITGNHGNLLATKTITGRFLVSVTCLQSISPSDSQKPQRTTANRLEKAHTSLATADCIMSSMNDNSQGMFACKRNWNLSVTSSIKKTPRNSSLWTQKDCFLFCFLGGFLFVCLFLGVGGGVLHYWLLQCCAWKVTKPHRDFFATL